MRQSVLPTILASLVLWGGASSAVFAQATTGTGGGPSSTVTAPHTSSVGRTMPPAGGDAGAATADENRERRTLEQKVDDKITRGICIGCGPK